MEEKNISEKKQTIYDGNTFKKLSHTGIGFLAGLVACIIIEIKSTTTNSLTTLWLAAILYILVVILFIYKKRRYIALGMILGLILAVITPLIVFHNCLGNL